MGTVLVTGGAGFIGSHTVEALQRLGNEVVVIDDLSKGLRTNVPDGTLIHEIDISDGQKIDAINDHCGPIDAIIHCAAQASVTASVSDPGHDLSVNILGTINVLELASKHQCPVVFTSTGGALYGEASPRPTPEATEIAPAAPYGASKAAAEIYLRMWAKKDSLPHAICRLGNVYGARQRGDGEAGVVSILASRIRRNEPVTLYGFGTPTRDYVHVDDVVQALIAAVGVSGTFNIATGIETSVEDVYRLVALGMDQAQPISPSLEPLRPGELQSSCLDCTSARDTLGWTAQISTEQGIPAVAAVLGSE